MKRQVHQYVERHSSEVRTESLLGHTLVRLLYSRVRENAPFLFKAFSSSRVTSILAPLSFDTPLGGRLSGAAGFIGEGIDFSECLEDPSRLNTPRKLFERQIRYWEMRPMPDGADRVVSPADARVLVGSLDEGSMLFIKDKFFSFEELLGPDMELSHRLFRGGDFAIFRLTAEKYHYNHTPVAGRVTGIYEIAGDCHSCNPAATVEVVTPYSKNRRVVTIIDTDVEGGTRVGLVAMIEIVALLVGDIVQCYSERRYDDPRPVKPGMFLAKGQPKSLYRPGSSTDVLLFQKGRVIFSEDLVSNMYRADVESIFSRGFGMSLAETDVRVRSEVARARGAGLCPSVMRGYRRHG